MQKNVTDISSTDFVSTISKEETSTESVNSDISSIQSDMSSRQESFVSSGNDSTDLTYSFDTSFEYESSAPIITRPPASSISTAEKPLYVPKSVTLSLYNSSSYGITWNTDKEPYSPVVQVSLGASFNEKSFKEFSAQYNEYSTYEYPNDNTKQYFISKAIIKGLETGKTYSYRCYDKDVKVTSEVFTFTARNTANNEFKFVHLSDSQVNSSTEGADTGIYLNNTFNGIETNAFNPDFILHTGDIVEWSKYESYWSDMINVNKKYFTSIPFAVISGNHEISYRNGSYETYKHFNYDLKSQDTNKGFYYSFDYGNARFIMLNTNRLTSKKLTSDQYDWLLSVLKNNPKKWTIVAMHNPIYSIGKYGSNPSNNGIALALREQLANVFAEYKVDLVLQGHDHAYSKTYPIGKNGVVDKDYLYEILDGIKYATNPNGVIYAMNGLSGNQSRSPYSIDNEIYEFASGSQVSSWAEISINNNLLTVNTYCYNNGTPKLWKSYGIKK